jgi:hypothetical protein
MPRWLPKTLARIHKLAAAGEIRLTHEAEREALLLGLSPEDVREVIAGLGAQDWASRPASSTTGEWMYVFKPDVGGQITYVKLILRDDCVVVSFHEDEGGAEEEGE